MSIVAIRTDLNLTQTEFAHRLGVSPGYIGDLERGRREISLTLAAKIEQTFKRKGVVRGRRRRKDEGARMTYFGGSAAKKIGMYRSNTAAACWRADLTAAWSFVPRIWNTLESPSSQANLSAMARRYRSAFRRPSTETNASTCTRYSTNSALGAGNSTSDCRELRHKRTPELRP